MHENDKIMPEGKKGTAEKEKEAPEKEPADSEDEFEYDENGEIIIPEVEYDDDFTDDDDYGDEDAESDGKAMKDDDDAEDTDEDDDENAPSNEAGDETAVDGKSGEEENAPAADTKPDERDIEIEKLRAELESFRMQAADALKAIGEEAEDPIRGLAKIAADSEGTTVDEYIESRRARAESEQKQALLRAQEYEKVFRADLTELHAAYPDTKQYDDIRKLPQDILKKFASFRDKGLTAKEAYAAANPDGIRTSIAASVKKQAMHESKEHLKSAVPKSSRDDSVAITKRELAEWKELFPGKSDAEIKALYKKTM